MCYITCFCQLSIQADHHARGVGVNQTVEVEDGFEDVDVVSDGLAKTLRILVGDGHVCLLEHIADLLGGVKDE